MIYRYVTAIGSGGMRFIPICTFHTLVPSTKPTTVSSAAPLSLSCSIHADTEVRRFSQSTESQSFRAMFVRLWIGMVPRYWLCAMCSRLHALHINM